MYILAGNKKEIINSEFVERFCIVIKPDAALVNASYSDVRPPVTMGKYADDKEGVEVLGDLYGALSGGAAYYTMPESKLFAEEKWKRDSRAKRKGGS